MTEETMRNLGIELFQDINSMGSVGARTAGALSVTGEPYITICYGIDTALAGGDIARLGHKVLSTIREYKLHAKNIKHNGYTYDPDATPVIYWRANPKFTKEGSIYKVYLRLLISTNGVLSKSALERFKIKAEELEGIK